MKAMPIIRVSSSALGACERAIAKASSTRKRMPRSRMARRAKAGRSRHTSLGSLDDCMIRVPPLTRPFSGLVCENTWWSGATTTSTSSSSALVTSTGSGDSVM